MHPVADGSGCWVGLSTDHALNTCPHFLVRPLGPGPNDAPTCPYHHHSRNGPWEPRRPVTAAHRYARLHPTLPPTTPHGHHPDVPNKNHTWWESSSAILLCTGPASSSPDGSLVVAGEGVPGGVTSVAGGGCEWTRLTWQKNSLGHT